MSKLHRLTSTALLTLAAAILLILTTMPTAATARPDSPEPPRPPVPTCTGFPDRLRAEGFAAPAAKHFGQAMRDDCRTTC